MGVIDPVGVILAGGAGRRMGGVSKAELMLGGQTLLRHAEDRLGPQVHTLAVNSAQPLVTPHTLITDRQPDRLGPLAGVLAGLDWAAQIGARHIVTVAVDTPFFPCDLVPNLILAAEQSEQGFAVAATQDGMQGTFGLWPLDLISALEAFLADGHRKVRTFAENHAAAHAQFPTTTPDAFFNINTPEDLTQAERWL